MHGVRSNRDGSPVRPCSGRGRDCTAVSGKQSRDRYRALERFFELRFSAFVISTTLERISPRAGPIMAHLSE
ncbi:hypothetical protein C7S13_3125 [Burkholderia cepacia]|nr:hypothetical protein [Burkholderia cepacia]